MMLRPSLWVAVIALATCGPAAPPTPTCTDGIKNAAETDVDCGGPTCGPCADGRVCGAAADCASAHCETSLCQPVLSVSKIVPPRGPIAGGTMVTLSGSGFRTGTTVLLGGASAPDASPASLSELRFTSPAHAMLERVDLTVQVGAQKVVVPTSFRYHWTTVGLSTTTNSTLPGPAEGMWLGDLNGDKLPDVVTANFGNANVSVLLGKAGGGFAPAVNYNANSQPSRVVVGDFDGDGKPDIALSNDTAGTVSVLINKGDATFKGPVAYPAGGAQAVGLIAADLNGDGKLDLAVANSGGTSRVAVLVGTGTGTFSQAVSYPAGAGAYNLIAGDFTGDGKLDLACSYNTGQMSAGVFVNNGDGTFKARTDLKGGASFGLAAADFDQDGTLDLALGSNAGPTLVVFLGKGDGSFQAPVTTMGLVGLSGMATGDVNRDGLPDLSMGSTTGVYLLLGTGDGGFGPPITSSGLDHNYTLAIADMNGDGKDDLVGVNQVVPRVSVLLGTAQ